MIYFNNLKRTYCKVKIMSPVRKNHHNRGRNGPVPKSSNIRQGYYLFCGEDHHRTDLSYVWSSIDMVSTNPPTYHTMHFQTKDNMLKFSADCSEIRGVISGINCDFQAGRMSETRKFKLYQDEWLPLIECFIINWGIARVPSDICWAVNDVQEAINVDTTRFPPFQLY